MNADEIDNWRLPDENGSTDKDGPKPAQEPTHDAERLTDGDSGTLVIPIDELDSLLHEINVAYADISEAGSGPLEAETTDAAADVDASAETGADKKSQHSAHDSDSRTLAADHAGEAGDDDDGRTRSMARKLAPRNGAPDIGKTDDPDSWKSQRLGQLRKRFGPELPIRDRPEPGLASDDQPGNQMMTQQVRGAMFGAGLTLVLFIAAISAFSFIEPLNRLLPDRPATVTENTGDNDVTASDQVHTGSIDVPDAAALNPESAAATDLPATGAASPTEAESTRAATRPDTKSDDRIRQDSVVQALLKDPEKRALQPGDQTAVEAPRPEFKADPVTTGSISISGDASAISETPKEFSRASPTKTDIAATTVKSFGLIKPADIGLSGSANDVTADAPNLAITPTIPAPKPELPASRFDEDAQIENGLKPPRSIADRLLKRAHGLLQRGDIAPARRLFRHVAAMGDSRGANGVAMTYDPETYKKIPVVGLTSDSEQAEAWYRKAQELSSKEAIYSDANADPQPGLQN